MPEIPVVESTRHFSTSMEKLVLTAIGPSMGRRYISLLNHYVDAKGLEWTVTRIKNLWNVALLLRAGMHDDIKPILDSGHINSNGRHGLPSGIEGLIVTIWSETMSPSKLRRWSVPLRSYTAIRLPELTESQLSKAKESITREGIEPDLVSVKGNKARQHALNNPGEVVTFLPYSMKKESVRRYLTLPKFSALSGVSNYPSHVRLKHSDKARVPFLSMTASLLTKGNVPDELIHLLGDSYLRQAAADVQEELDDDTFGRISVIQEGGAKARVICSPNAWVQLYMMPMHQALMRYISHLEANQRNSSWQAMAQKYIGGISCVTDQVSGAYLAAKKLSEGSFAMGVDLSSATDRFPLSLQQTTLDELYLPEYAVALAELAGPYTGLDGEEWEYGQGQPMGLYGSFPLFHITHYSLLNGLSLNLGLPGNGENFAVVGDDVIIFDERLLHAYQSFLDEWDIPVSWHKSFTGDLIEFAGFVITRTSEGKISSFRPYKHGDKGTFSSVLNVLHAIGSPAKKWSKRWGRNFDLYQKTLSDRSLDLSPLISFDESYGLEAKLTPEYFMSCVETLTHSRDFDFIPFEYLFEDSQDEIASLVGQTTKSTGYKATAQGSFNPELYIVDEKRRKSLFQGFFSDPLVAQAMLVGSDEE